MSVINYKGYKILDSSTGLAGQALNANFKLAADTIELASTAAGTSVDVSPFSGNLGPADTDVQAALETIDALVLGTPPDNDTLVVSGGYMMINNDMAGNTDSFHHGSGATAGSNGAFAQGRLNVHSKGTGSFAQGLGNATAKSIYAGASGVFAQGYAKKSGAGNVKITASAVGSFVQGQVYGNSANTTYIKSTQKGSFAQGYIKNTVASNNVIGISGGLGVFSQGYAVSASVGCVVSPYGSSGSFAQGFAYGKDVKANAKGSFAQGFARSAGFYGSGGSIEATGNGSFAQGSGGIYAANKGAFAQGNGYYGIIKASGIGSFAQGYLNIYAKGNGAFAQGFGNSDLKTIYAKSAGSFAHGYAKVTIAGNSKIAAEGIGSFAHGYTFGNLNNAACIANITATGAGSFAAGCLKNTAATTHKISAEAAGAFAFGYASNTTISATASNAFQFGPGTNSTADTLQVESGVLIKGDGDINAQGELHQSMADLAANAVSEVPISLRTAYNVNFKTVANTNIFTVPAGFEFLIDTMEIITTASTGAGTAPTVQFGTVATPAQFYGPTITTSVLDNNREVVDSPQDAVAGGAGNASILLAGITVASTYTTHTGYLRFTGTLIKVS